MFDAKSRYAGLTLHKRIDRRGRVVQVVPTPPAVPEDLMGYHARIEGQRLDHMADRYLDNPAGFWRICDLNDAMLPEALSEAHDIAIPEKHR